MDSIDVYPSTSDVTLKRIAGGQDAVLAILEGARRRYKRNGVRSAYVGKGQVCAVGAVMREAGVTPKQFDDGEVEFGGYGFDSANAAPKALAKALKAAEIEQSIIKAAKEAMKLLDRSARKLFPTETKPDNRKHAYFSGGYSWSGPLEELNQELSPRKYRKAVLSCYDHAIEARKAATATS